MHFNNGEREEKRLAVVFLIFASSHILVAVRFFPSHTHVLKESSQHLLRVYDCYNLLWLNCLLSSGFSATFRVDICITKFTASNALQKFPKEAQELEVQVVEALCQTCRVDQRLQKP